METRGNRVVGEIFRQRTGLPDWFLGGHSRCRRRW